MQGTYSLPLVGLSIVIAVAASYAAIGFAEILAVSRGRRWFVWLAAGALSFGIGIWSMHYLGMLAFSLPVPILYYVPIVLVSMVIGVVASGATLCILELPRVGGRILIAGSLLMGGGIGAMHYTGMAAMRIPVMHRYDLRIVALSIVVAVVFAALAIKIGLYARTGVPKPFFTRLAAATLMGLGIASMHYTGMAAMRYLPIPMSVNTHWTVSIGSVEVASIALMTLVVLAAAFLSTSIDKYLVKERSIRDAILGELEDANRLRAAILESTALSIIATDMHGIIVSVNKAAERTLGYNAADLIGKFALTTIHSSEESRDQALALTRKLKAESAPPPDQSTAPPDSPASDWDALVAAARQGVRDERDVTYLRKDGSRIYIRLSVTTLKSVRRQNQGFLAVAQDVTEQKKAEDSIRHMALHDALTGLPNRACLERRVKDALAEAHQQRSHLALALLDLDRFKHINDTLGHHAGDEILKTVAARLTASVRSTDTVARLGGDEFVILMPHIDHPSQSFEIMQRVLRALNQPIRFGRHELYVPPSIGICSYPADGRELDTLLRRADRAMYVAKERSRNNVVVYTQEMEKNTSGRLDMESALRRALARNEFSLMYQPLIEVATGRVTGVEALLRWKSGNGDLIPPVNFIPLAEETGLILKIGSWALRTACAMVEKFSRAAGAQLRMSVNISPSQFRDPALLETIDRLLLEYQIPHGYLQLEITEGVMLEARDGTAETIAGLRARGIKVALDDYGTGYSSLAYLRRFPLDRLKIDRTFIAGVEHNHEDASLTAGIIALGHNLNLHITAEGVEDAAQLEYLRRHGCDDAQGNYLACPMFPDKLMAFLSARAQTAAGRPPVASADPL